MRMKHKSLKMILSITTTFGLVLSNIQNVSYAKEEVETKDLETKNVTEEPSTERTETEETEIVEPTEDNVEEQEVELIEEVEALNESEQETEIQRYFQIASSNPNIIITKNNNQLTCNQEGLILLSNANASFAGYTIFLSSLGGGYADLTNTVSAEGNSYSFKGFGNSETPFEGNIQSQDVQYGFILNTPFFNVVDVGSVTLSNLDTLKIKRKNSTSCMLAKNIINKSNSSWNSLNIVLETYVEEGSEIYYYPGELIDTINANASLSLNAISFNTSEQSDKKYAACISKTNSNAGLLCNTLQSSSVLSLESLSINGNVFVESKKSDCSAGGIIGEMDSLASLSINTVCNIDSKFTIKADYAGGVIGKGKNVNLSNTSFIVGNLSKPKIYGKVAAGGLFGSYTYDIKGENVYNTYDSNSNLYIKSCTLSSNDNTENTGEAFLGGIFGILDIDQDFEIKNADITVTNQNLYQIYGGLIGQIHDSKDNENLSQLTISGSSKVSITNDSNITYFGGAIGEIDGVYVNVKNTLKVIATGMQNLSSEKHYFGGIAGNVQNKCVLEFDKEASISINTNTKEIKYGGGIVGQIGPGSTICLNGVIDLSNINFIKESTYSQKPEVVATTNYAGQIVGVQESSLVYAKKDWTLKRPITEQKIDDIGNYGSVIRLGKNIGQGSTLGNDGGLSNDLISQDKVTHKTKFSKTVSMAGNTITISNTDEFALLSINEQTKGYFDLYTSIDNDYVLQSNPTIVLEADVDLRNTGISSLQRDYYLEFSFEGTFEGNGHNITLATGEKYGLRKEANSTGFGSGQIHGHSQIGLFSQTGGTFNNLTIDGEINTIGRSNSEKAIGGICALNTSSTTFDKVNTKVSINCSGDNTNQWVGGLIGKKIEDADSLKITNCKGQAAIDVNTNEKGIFGGLVGYISSFGNIEIANTEISGSIKTGTQTDARIGGLIGVIESVDIDNDVYREVTLKLTDIKVDSQTIESKASETSGGLLGYDWNNTKVYFGTNKKNGIQVTGESKVILNDDASCGALVYSATGYWQVNQIQLKELNVTSKSGNLALLLCNAWKHSKETGSYLLYLEEKGYQAYSIDSSKVLVQNQSGYFDEWVIKSCNSSITNNGNSVVSIATEDGGDYNKRKGVDPTQEECSTYSNRTQYGKQIQKENANPMCRYYYDLDVIRVSNIDIDNGKVDSANELMLWSVWRYAEKTTDKNGNSRESNIAKYFWDFNESEEKPMNDITNGFIDGKMACINLKGYSYYPINFSMSSLTVKNITISFDNETIELAEQKSTSDLLDRDTTGTGSTHTQHYLMHSGLILNFTYNSTTSGIEKDVKLNVNNASFQGTIGLGPNSGSGALICGILGAKEGTNTIHYVRANLREIQLDGVIVNGPTGSGDHSAILINNIGSFVSIDVEDVSQKNYEKGIIAATSLIGDVGYETASNISVAFYGNIDLKGQKSESIFSHATLLESFQYSDANSSGYYHFNEEEKCTYGIEITHTLEYTEEKDGKQVSRQQWYYDKQSGDKEEWVKVNDNGNTEFSKNLYLPYVCQTKVNQPTSWSGYEKNTYHEIEVNLLKPDLIEGCGTYDDPYIISDAGQLEEAAKFINGASPFGGWKVNKVNDETKVKSEEDSNHELYEAGSTSWNDDEMRQYLRNAYYLIDNDLNLTNFAGFGTLNSPFVGVIDGKMNTITINATKNESGLINVSYGSVVQNINIVYTGKKTVIGNSAVENSNGVSQSSYFGGIYGYILGGDSIIDNVSISFDKEFSITLGNNKSCAGGIIGLVEAGGVVLKNMDEEIVNSLPIENVSNLYADALVGRVLEGYVINEVNDNASGVFKDIANKNKNYSIANISNSASISMDASGKISIANPQQYLILCDIVNSGASNGGFALAYNENAKTRNADYSKIGTVDQSVLDIARKDENVSNENLPYLIRKYAGDNSSFWSLCGIFNNTRSSSKFAGDSGRVSGYVKLSLNITSNLDFSVYKNGYRSLGARYNTRASSYTAKNENIINNENLNGNVKMNTPFINSIDGNSNTITIDVSMKEVSQDNFHANTAGGFINVLRHLGATINNFTVTGTISYKGDITNYSNGLSVEDVSVAVGGLIGRDFSMDDKTEGDELKKWSSQPGYHTVTFISVNCANLNVIGTYIAGGMVGSSNMLYFQSFPISATYYDSDPGTNNVDLVKIDNAVRGKMEGEAAYLSRPRTNLKFTDCSNDKIDIQGGLAAGGFIGVATSGGNSTFSSSGLYGTRQDSITFTFTKNIVVNKNAKIHGFTSSYGDKRNGYGGIIGFCNEKFTFNKEKKNVLMREILIYSENDTKNYSRMGGVVGYATSGWDGIPYIYKLDLENCYIGLNSADTSNLSSYCGYSSGGIIGDLSISNKITTYENVSIKNCVILANSYSGGFVGYNNTGSQVTYVKTSTIENTTIKSDLLNGGVGSLTGCTSGYMFAVDVLIKNMDIGGKTSNKGRIIGKGMKIRATSISVQQDKDKMDSLPKRDVGDKGYSNLVASGGKSYFSTDYGDKMFIIYDGYQNENIKVGADLKSKPTVNIPGLTNLRGDTLKPSTILKIYKDSTLYQNVSTANQKFVIDQFMKKDHYEDTENLLKENIASTYNEQQDEKISDSNDFEVLMVDGDASVIRQYLNAATNGGFESIRILTYWWNHKNATPDTTTLRMRTKVEIERYSKVDGQDKFVLNKDLPTTLIYTEDTGEFKATNQYDNQNNTFTLVKVTFYGEPANGNVRYVYIPVVVRRVLQLDYITTMTSGTTFSINDEDYKETKYHALASKGESITGYLTFKYNSNVSDALNPASYDWKSYLEGGGNLLGFYKKTLNTGTLQLASQTEITLIDCQDNDHRYYAKIDANQTSNLELFNGNNLTFVDSNGKEFVPKTISELLEIEAVESENGQWVEENDISKASIVDINQKYYRLKTDKDVNAVTYDISIGNNSPEENYYVVIRVPKAENHRLTLRNSDVVWSNNNVNASPVETHQIHRGTDSKDTSASSEASFNYLENYKQELVDLESNKSIAISVNDANATLGIKIKNEITFDPNNYEPTDPLYQKLVVSLKKTEDDKKTTVGIPSDAIATADDGKLDDAVKLYAYYENSNGRHYYSWNGSKWIVTETKTAATSYAWSGNTSNTEMELPFAIKTETRYEYLDLSELREKSKGTFYLEAETNLKISVASIMQNSTVPGNDGEAVRNYTQVEATSYLSFAESGLPYSMLKGSTCDQKNILKYCLDEQRKAVLKLDYSNIDQLGINVGVDTSSDIDTNLTLDLSNAEGFSEDIKKFKLLQDTSEVKFTFSLQQKGKSNDTYTTVSIADYMSGASITSDDKSLNDYTITIYKENNGSFPYYNEQTGQFTIPIRFRVKVDESLLYANYRICVSVQIFNGNNELSFALNKEKAFITYTYAKLNVNGIWNTIE